MKPIRELISREIIDDLWGAGYTILPRRRYADPFFVPEDIIPQGRAYQWMHLIHDRAIFESGGWAPVPAVRHDGFFMPAGYVGDIEVNGLGLFEKPKFEIEAERQANIQKAKDQADPAKFFAGKGFTGSVTVAELDTIKTTTLSETKTIEDVTKIPRELTPYIAQIFEERDRLLLDEWRPGTANSDINAIALENNAKAYALNIAIDNIRKRIKEEAEHGQAS